MALTVTLLGAADVPAIIAVLRDAFFEYPVMRFVLGPAEPYAPRLERLVGLFVQSRALRHDPLLGIREGGTLAAAATLTAPDSPAAPPDLLALRERVWADLGADARARYDAYARATAPFAPAARHYHVNMIGVRPALQGRGYARALLDAVHALAARDPAAAGVSLDTERVENLAFYGRLAYTVHGHTRVGPGLETWGLFRPREVS